MLPSKRNASPLYGPCRLCEYTFLVNVSRFYYVISHVTRELHEKRIRAYLGNCACVLSWQKQREETFANESYKIHQ